MRILDSFPAKITFFSRFLFSTMCCFVQYFFLLALLLIAIANPLPDNENQNAPPLSAVPSDYFDTASSTSFEQSQKDLTFKLPEDYSDADVVPYDWFIPHCKTPETLCCRPSFFTDLYKKVYSILGDDVLFGCSRCMPHTYLIFIIQSTKMGAP